MNFLFLFVFYQSTVLSSLAVDGHQNHMYFGGSVIGKASTIGRDTSHTPHLIFTGSQKMRKLASFKTSLNFEPTDKRLSSCVHRTSPIHGEDTGRSFLHNRFVSALGYLAACSNASRSKLSDVENDAKFRTFYAL